MVPLIFSPGNRRRWAVNLTLPIALLPRKEYSMSVEYEAGWAPESVWRFWAIEHLSPLSWIEIESLDCVARSLATVPTDTSPLLTNPNKGIVNPLNAELNPICHLLVLFGDLTFMGPCIISIFQHKCISNKMRGYKVYLYLETALHVSGGTSTQHQKRIQLYLQHLVFVTPLLLSAAIVEELELVWVAVGGVRKKCPEYVIDMTRSQRTAVTI
jgi:hypothetical protein